MERVADLRTLPVQTTFDRLCKSGISGNSCFKIISIVEQGWSFYRSGAHAQVIRTLTLILFLLACPFTHGQSPLGDFKQDFERATRKDFNEEQLDQMFSTHSSLLTPHSSITRLTADLKGETIAHYPLAEFKADKVYRKNIPKLFDSDNPYHRILAYLVIAGTGDRAFEPGLLNKLKVETGKGNLIWAGMALMYLNTTHTTPLFDFLVANENFRDAHMLPLFIQLNPDSLRQTAYLRIHSKQVTAQVLAAQILSRTSLEPRTEEVLKEAVRTWDIGIKGYAIYSIKELQIGDLLETFQPLLDSARTRNIALEALANSPTPADKQYLLDLVDKQDTVPEELLDCFYGSKQAENVRYWLELLSRKPLPQDYVFFVFKQPLLSTDELLPDLHHAFEKISDPKILHELVRALKGRTDARSVDIMISLLDHEDSTVRYWAARSLKGNTSLELVNKLPGLLTDPATRTVALVDLVLQHEVDTLQTLFVSIYENGPNLDWKRSSVEYLSAYPMQEHAELFRAILREADEDPFIRRNAALGLGRLQDKGSVELIIAACRQESAGSDFNAQTYLIALGLIKGARAREEVEEYKDSKEQTVRELVAELLSTW